MPHLNHNIQGVIFHIYCAIDILNCKFVFSVAKFAPKFSLANKKNNLGQLTWRAISSCKNSCEMKKIKLKIGNGHNLVTFINPEVKRHRWGSNSQHSAL